MKLIYKNIKMDALLNILIEMGYNAEFRNMEYEVPMEKMGLCKHLINRTLDDLETAGLIGKKRSRHLKIIIIKK